jgi:hypothetical protein
MVSSVPLIWTTRIHPNTTTTLRRTKARVHLSLVVSETMVHCPRQTRSTTRARARRCLRVLMQHHYHSPLYKQAPSFLYPFKFTMSRIQRVLNSLTKGRVPALISTRCDRRLIMQFGSRPTRGLPSTVRNPHSGKFATEEFVRQKRVTKLGNR